MFSNFVNKKNRNLKKGKKLKAKKWFESLELMTIFKT